MNTIATEKPDGDATKQKKKKRQEKKIEPEINSEFVHQKAPIPHGGEGEGRKSIDQRTNQPFF